MALDEALLWRAVSSGGALARFYRWNAPALTVGYSEARRGTTPPGAVRRFTGGGLVEHGEDVTFALALPAGSEAAGADAPSRYAWIHRALALALGGAGLPVALVAEAGGGDGPCFAHPVESDLIDPETGAKLGGGAQRRSRGAVIHQGSLRLPSGLRHPRADWVDRFCGGIAETTAELPLPEREALMIAAGRLENERYGTDDWNRPGFPGRGGAGEG
jgi:lipoate-protein ligase A